MKRSLFPVPFYVFLIACFFAVSGQAAPQSKILLYRSAFIRPAPPEFSFPPRGDGRYVVIAWNDLGMHCMDSSFEDFAVLPPYNTLVAQVVRRGPSPAIVTQGLSVSYRILGNTSSVNKTNFWRYAQSLFSLKSPLQPDIGLAGKGLSGSMDPAGTHFKAEGIPLTEIFDNHARSPYQLAEVVVRDSQGKFLAATQTVVPVSTEMHCDNCHANGGSANPAIATGSTKRNILTLHDQLEGTTLMANRPVLCANCHSSNALGTPGRPGLPNLSRAVHGKHAWMENGTVAGTCYQCHPGPQTKCLRGAMAKAGEKCQNCHGTMTQVASTQRRPWIDEPRCGSCHGAAYQENPGVLYRFSTGHKGIMCQACHGSTHAVYPSTLPIDNRQSIWLQGYAGTINKCAVCHTNTPDRGEGPHRKSGD